ncbi:MAG: type II secretion system protein [Candidatus Riflebacteria bacterium]|nr:type II secretion system protein [Candidatus Riflebacteria bacterium]
MDERGRARNSRRRPRTRWVGLSLLELLIAVAIVIVALASIFDTLRQNRSTYLRLDALVVGRLLAESIMDQAVHRFQIEDERFFDLSSTPVQIAAAARRGDWKRPFLALARSKTPVLTPPGRSNPYFDPTTGPVLPSDPGELRFFQGFAYEVTVSFDRSKDEEGPTTSIDSDGDSRGETDMARIVVEVFYRSADGPPIERSVCRLSTFVVVRDKAPGVQPLSEH